MKSIEERRLKILRVDPRYIVDLLNQAANPTQFMKIPTGDLIPDGTVVVSLNANWSRGCIELLLSHEQFEPVEMGMEPEAVGLMESWRVIDLSEYRQRISESFEPVL